MYAKVKDGGITLNANGLTIYGSASFIAESPADLDILPTDEKTAPSGSNCLVIPTGEVWMIGPSRKWIKYQGVSILGD